jgi:sugar/nucleoside kinase (ribokinase family)/fructoselysine-6-P-deglycase FrlB-like protein
VTERVPVFAAVGELICDHVFTGPQEERRYLGSFGGGSAFNTLVEAASCGARSFAIAASGEDQIGTFVRDALAAVGVDIGLVRPNGGHTKVAFELLTQGMSGSLEGAENRFTSTCPVCRWRRPESSVARWRGSLEVSALRERGIEMLLMDRLTAERFQLATEAAQVGIRSALHLGRLGHLRYLPATQTVSELRAFDTVLLSLEVAVSLKRRLGLEGRGFEEIASLIEARFMAVSRGREGVEVHHRGRSVFFEFPQPHPVVDGAGLDDVLFAHFLLACRQDLGSMPPWSDGLTPLARERLAALLDRIGARGHLPTIPPPLELAQRIGWGLEELRNELNPARACHFCGHRRTPPSRPSVRKPGRRPGAADAVGWLRRRMLHATERGEALEGCRQLLRSGGSCFVVGSGGSYPVASFISLALDHHSDVFAKPIRPFDYVRLAKRSDLVVVVSYSGSTPDCAEVISRAKVLGVGRIVLLTAATDPPLASSLDLGGADSVISYGNPEVEGRGERGFVSIAGTVAPAALWAAAVSSRAALVDIAHEFKRIINDDVKAATLLAKAIELEHPVAIFGGGLAWPAMHDLESKFVEGDIAEFQVHEAKDFSHGRFVSVLDPERTPRVALLFGVGAPTEYEELLDRTLRDSGNPGFGPLHLVTPRAGMAGALELLVRVQFLAERCARLLGRDISRPEWIPPAGLDLYRWNQGLGGAAIARRLGQLNLEDSPDEPQGFRSQPRSSSE